MNCIHAEQRAIADAARSGISTDHTSMYVNLRPCMQCLAIAKAAGVCEVFYGANWTNPDDVEAVYRTLSAEFDVFNRIDAEPEQQIMETVDDPSGIA